MVDALQTRIVPDGCSIVKTFINKDRKNIQIEEIVKTEPYYKQKRKLQYAMRMREQEAHEAYAAEHKHGYCPHCGMLIPMSGECDCGYNAKERR